MHILLIVSNVGENKYNGIDWFQYSLDPCISILSELLKFKSSITNR